MRQEIQREEETSGGARSDPPLGHDYYRRVYEGKPPRVGDQALCGHIKVDPRNHEDKRPGEVWPTCIVCADLRS